MDSHSLLRGVEISVCPDLKPGEMLPVPAGGQGHHAGRDHKLRAIAATASRVSVLKLATVHPQLDFNNLSNLLAIDVRTKHLYTCSNCHIRLLLSDRLAQLTHMPILLLIADASSVMWPAAELVAFPAAGIGCASPYMSQGTTTLSVAAWATIRPPCTLSTRCFCRPMGSQQRYHFLSDAASQVRAFWQDLQSVVQMDMEQSQEITNSFNSYGGQ
ncbi:hypothetical protein ZWY2020_028523 [Hordeum vulgare]|nr:hypothetical protein ZWY2020_028523 [Hordeum vulgare]